MFSNNPFHLVHLNIQENPLQELLVLCPLKIKAEDKTFPFSHTNTNPVFLQQKGMILMFRHT